MAKKKKKKKPVYQSEHFYKPFENSQKVAFPEQARINDNRLEVFRYELVYGLVEALSQRIEQE